MITVTNKDNYNLIVCCNILSRVETFISKGTRVQLSKDTLSAISSYLARAINYVDGSNSLFSSQLYIFGKCIESIDSVENSDNFFAVNNNIKEYLVDKLCPAITEFKVNVGKYLTDKDFDYSPSMFNVLKGIVDTCISNGYYFGY